MKISRTALLAAAIIPLLAGGPNQGPSRSGDRGAQNISSLLILKTTVESFTPGSEAKRAVTTIAGATKIKVRSQLCTDEGEVLLERVVHGNVRFIGANLRATHNLARNVAKSIHKATLPSPRAQTSFDS